MMTLFRWIWRLMWVTALGVGCYLVYLFFEIGHEVEPLIHFDPPQTTQILDRHGQHVAYIFNREHRFYADYAEIPGSMVEALVAIEDTLFFEHHGVNPDAIFRAIIKDISTGRLAEGASTLTQQLVKNTLLSREKKIMRKIKEALLAIRLEQLLSKEEIIERYLNAIFFGHGYYGVKTAARGYFHKELDDLSLKEIAMLVGLPRAPSAYDPTRYYEQATARANHVLERMRVLGWINEAAYLEAVKSSPKVYNDTLTQNRAPYVTDEIVRMLSKRIHDFKTGGYVVETTVDLEFQAMARKALQSAYEAFQKRHADLNDTTLNGAMVVMENASGDILSLVGGVDYSRYPFNRATQSKRQPGSSFKPFIYEAALNLGYNPQSSIADIARTYRFEEGETDKLWKPKNYEKDFKGVLSLREALVHSRNLATINLVREVGIGNIRDQLAPFKIKDLPYDLSIALGNIAVSPVRMASLYTVFSDMGTYHEPRLVRRILRRRAVVRNYDVRSKEIFKPEQAYLMVDMLKDVVRRGTGRNARVRGIEVAGKTGTTNNNVDAWFCSFTPDIESVVWFGNDDNSPMPKRETGGRTAAPAARIFYQSLFDRHPEYARNFEEPEGVMRIQQKGKSVIFTEISPLPIKTMESQTEEIIF